jgi:hypothetical protein
MEAMAAIIVEDAKTSVQRLQEETLGARNSGVGAWMEGNQLGIGKREDSLVENRRKQWEQPMSATHSGCGWMQGKSENCNSVTNPDLLFHTG